MLTTILLFASLFVSTDCFVATLHPVRLECFGKNKANQYHCQACYSKHRSNQGIALYLVPLAQFDDQVKFLQSPDSSRLGISQDGYLKDDSNNENNPYMLYVVEEDDLPDISRLTVDAFGAATVTLSGELNEFERALIGPTVGLWNAYTDIFAYTEVLTGLRARLGDRLKEASVSLPIIAEAKDRSDSHRIASAPSIVLAVARPRPSGNYVKVEPIATVELRLQPTDAKIPFSQPWLDDIERKAAKVFRMRFPAMDKELQPYLSNLCVAQNARGKKIGKALVRCVESIAKNAWGYEKLYLHVDLENTAAVTLYKSEGYQDVVSRWKPFWAGKAAEIGYFVKKL